MKCVDIYINLDTYYMYICVCVCVRVCVYVYNVYVYCVHLVQIKKIWW